MKQLRWPAGLMGLAIVCVTGFQGYWLKENYTREKKALGIKTEAAFREAILELQVAKLKLDKLWQGNKDSGTGKFVFMDDKMHQDIRVKTGPPQKIISTINVIGGKLRDSLKIKTTLPPSFLISMNKAAEIAQSDSVRLERHFLQPGENRIFNLLYGVDSLQDSLSLEELIPVLKKRLKEEKIDIPFTILRLSGSNLPMTESNNEITLGVMHPVTYRFVPGNTQSYLLKKISLPIIFSVVLIGITVFSFLLLYRNMMKQKRLAALKNEFISNITHELKTPIATVGVAIEALKNFNAINDPRKTNEYLSISQNELQRLSLLVDKVLKLSMFENKELELKYEPVHLRELVDEVAGSLKLQFEKHKAVLEVSQEGTVQVQGDRLHLLSVFYNLLDNALKYSREEPVIKVHLEEQDEMVLLKVSDNGIGIPPAFVEKVFEKFFRVPQGDVHNAKGYGLGLSYSSEVIRKHQGTIQVSSEPGAGTTFQIKLPKNPGIAQHD